MLVHRTQFLSRVDKWAWTGFSLGLGLDLDLLLGVILHLRIFRRLQNECAAGGLAESGGRRYLRLD